MPGLNGPVGQYLIQLQKGTPDAIGNPPTTYTPVTGSFTSYEGNLDQFHPLSQSGHYAVVPKSINVVPNHGGQIAYLVNHFDSHSLTTQQAAGLQVALWELEYDPAVNSYS